MAQSADSANYPTPDEILAGILASLRYQFSRDGIRVNVLPGSDHWRRAKAFADQISIALANNKISVAAASPLTAQGQDLLDLAAVFGVRPRPATGAAGYLLCMGTVGSTIPFPAGFQATLANGTKVQVTTPTTVVLAGQTTTPPVPVPVQAVKTGDVTNADPAAPAQWDSAAFGMLSPKCIVGSGGLTGGLDDDSVEVVRARLLRKLSQAAIGGNWAHVRDLAESSSAAVELAFVYPAVRGPGSVDVAVTSAGGDRVLSSPYVASALAKIRAEMTGFESQNVTTVTAQAVDVILDAKLPLPTNAGGSGGGWKDAAPWPSAADAVIPKVTAVNSTSITVNSTSANPPTAGARFCLWNATTKKLVEFTAQAVTGSSGAYVITMPIPSWVTTGLYVSAAAMNLVDYGDDFIAEIARLGPGEKTAHPFILPRGRRHPPPDLSSPASLTEIQTSAVIAKHPEVLGLSYAARYAAGTTTARTAPSIPATTADAPNILTLNQLAIRRAV